MSADHCDGRGLLLPLVQDGCRVGLGFRWTSTWTPQCRRRTPRTNHPRNFLSGGQASEGPRNMLRWLQRPIRVPRGACTQANTEGTYAADAERGAPTQKTGLSNIGVRP